jgi:hypothetical protein
VGFTGLGASMDGGVNLDDEGDRALFARGPVMATGNVRLFAGHGNAGCDPRATAHLQITASTSSTTGVVPGTWQELPPS